LIEIHDALLVAVHEHSRAAETAMFPVPPVALNDAVVPPTATWHFEASGAVSEVCVVVEHARREMSPSVVSSTTGGLPMRTATRDRNAHGWPTASADFG
jgi:hypothetical protein